MTRQDHLRAAALGASGPPLVAAGRTVSAWVRLRGTASVSFALAASHG
ncbi:MAG TPA: hypothetical protein VGP96_16745 [Candidatus Dormibacteraeota bacterium]|nr:hypothetical protein [Candidatus Dormibacteraeota bacterium]